MFKKYSALLLAGILVSGTVLATGCAHWRHHSPEERATWMVEKVTKKLSLTEIQKTKLNALRDQLLSIANEHKDSHEAMHTDVLALLSQPTFDRHRATGLVDGRIKAVNEKAPLVINAFADFYDSLDTTQQAKIKEFVEERMEHFGPGMGHHH